MEHQDERESGEGRRDPIGITVGQEGNRKRVPRRQDQSRGWLIESPGGEASPPRAGRSE